MSDLIYRITQWFPDFIEKVILALGIAIAFEIVVRLAYRAIDRALRVAMMRPGERDVMKRLKRRKTLTTVAQSAARWVLYFVAFIWILRVLGVAMEQLKVLLGGAALVGLAISFGAQKLIRDVITGFLLIAEDQYDVGDRVTIGATTGTVQEVGIRITRLRDDDGNVHFVANGDITRVCNHTRGHTKITIDIALPTAADVERARAAVAAVGTQLAAEHKGISTPAQVEEVSDLSGGAANLRVAMVAPASEEERLTTALREAISRRFAEEGIRRP